MFPLTDVVEVHSSKNLFETEQPWVDNDIGGSQMRINLANDEGA
jgi:hypothetical protein